MGPVRDDEHDRPSYARTKSAARLFNELVERVSPDASDKAKSPPFTNEAGLLPNTTSSPPPMDAPNFTHTTSKSKDTSSNLPQRIFESFQSQYDQHQPHDPSPTDSHPRNHPRSHTRRRSSRSSETISAMLLLATERLAQETSRANEAERQSSEILAHFKIAHHAKQRLEIDLQKANNELGLYKTQLDIAQAEIRRAQEIVNKVDRQRADAEDEARRGRDKIRKLTEVRSIELAMEEGRRLGYEEGMRQGRLMMQARDNELNQPTRYSRRTSVRSARDDDDDDQVTYFSYTQEEWQSTESFRSSSEPSTSVRSLSRRRRTSDARHAAHPIPPISTSPPTSHNQIPSTTQPNDDANEPENIAVRPHPTKDTSPTIPIRPISIQNHSPTVSHRSFKLPPDGYIPIIDANSVISLPPPHELSNPVPPTSAPQPSATASSSKQERKKTSTSRSSEHADRESRKRTPQSVDGDSTFHYTLSRQPHTNNRHKEPAHNRPRSEASGASTYISHSSLLGPPDSNDIGKNENNEEADYFTAGTRRMWSPSQASTQFERIPSKRRVNPDTIPPSPSPAQSSFDRYNATTSKMQGNFIIERPSSTDPTKRFPREIVISTPLMGSLLDPSTVQKPNGASQEAFHQWRNDVDRSSSPGYHNPRPQYVRGSVSNISVPGIKIVTPSSPTLSTPSARTVIDPILLTPESARSTPLLQPTTEVPPTTTLGLYSNPPFSMSMLGDEQRITMVLPDNNLPPGFIPLSPIPGMKNLDSYPSGFAPSMSKLQDEYPGGQLPSNFSYPSSPLIKSGA